MWWGLQIDKRNNISECLQPRLNDYEVTLAIGEIFSTQGKSYFNAEGENSPCVERCMSMLRGRIFSMSGTVCQYLEGEYSPCPERCVNIWRDNIRRCLEGEYSPCAGRSTSSSSACMYINHEPDHKSICCSHIHHCCCSCAGSVSGCFSRMRARRSPRRTRMPHSRSPLSGGSRRDSPRPGCTRYP